jgi:hypothetical protein
VAQTKQKIPTRHSVIFPANRPSRLSSLTLHQKQHLQQPIATPKKEAQFIARCAD